MSALTSLQARVARYLVERRRLGFSDHSQTYALRSFARHVQAVSHRGPLTVEVMGDWSDAARISPLLATLFLGCMGFTILGGRSSSSRPRRSPWRSRSASPSRSIRRAAADSRPSLRNRARYRR